MSASDNNARAIPPPANLLKHKGSACMSQLSHLARHPLTAHLSQYLSPPLREKLWPNALASLLVATHKPPREL
jgi:hypothetical protein